MQAVPAGPEAMMKTEIQTERLRLVALTMEQLDLCLADQGSLSRELGVSFSPQLVDEPVRRAAGFKKKKMSGLPPEQHPWCTFWLVVIAAEPHGVGMAGFKGPPDDRGEVEIGYGIDPAYRNRGYTTEAVQALIAWAWQDTSCRSILADTMKDNAASSRVLAKVGMRVYHETDEGLCWKLERGNSSLP